MFAPPLALAVVAPTPPAERAPEAAAAVVRRLYAALDAKRFRQAYALWSGGHSYAAYRAGYAHTVRTRVTTVPPYASDAGMGSSWATIPVRVEARLDDGTRQRFAGSYTLRRVNDVDGSSAAQRRWHIVGAKLRRAG
jgi:hypothetical protein